MMWTSKNKREQRLNELNEKASVDVRLSDLACEVRYLSEKLDGLIKYLGLAESGRRVTFFPIVDSTKTNTSESK